MENVEASTRCCIRGLAPYFGDSRLSAAIQYNKAGHAHLEGHSVRCFWPTLLGMHPEHQEKVTRQYRAM